MNIGELFVSLGIKGSEQTTKSLTEVKSGLSDVASMSLEAKAGILAAMYAVEELGRHSANAGNDLVQFENVTGMSLVTLQKFQGAARQFGVGANDVTSSIKGIQSAMTNMAMGKGAPEAMALFTRYVGGIDKTKLNDAFYLVQKFQEFAQKAPPNLTRMLAPSMGITEGMLSAMHQGAFTSERMAKMPTYSEREAGSLQKVQVGWANLGVQIEMAMGHLNAKHGLEMIKNISALTKEVLRFADALLVLSEKLRVFEFIGAVFDGLTKTMRLLNGETATAIGKDDKGKRHFGDGTWWMNAINGLEDGYLKSTDPQHNLGSRQQALANLQPVSKTGNSTTINQNITHHGDAKDTKAVKDTHRTAIQGAARQFQPGGI